MTSQALERHQPGAAPAVFNDREMKSIEWQAKAITALDRRLEGTAEEKKALGEALAITLYSLGVPVTVTNAKKLHIINGEVVESSQLLTGLLAMHGHEVRVVEESDERAVVRGRRNGTGEPYEVTYTIDQARRSGALDEWVEKWEKTSGGKNYPVRHYLVFEGEPNTVPPEPWAKTLIDRKQTKRLDAWHRYTSDMLVNRAIRRLAKRMGGDALMGVGGADWDADMPAPMAVRDDDIVIDDEFGEPLDEPAAGGSGKVQEDAAPPAPAAPLDEADPAAARRNERAKIFAAFSRIPEGLWRQQWAKAWRDAGFPGEVQDLADEQLEPARQVVRTYIALAALYPLGFKADERHAFVAKATGQESTKGLSAEQLKAVLDAVADEVAFREAAAAEEPDPFDSEEG
jgi:hypothetical protein